MSEVNKRWYVVHAYSGFEKSVAQALRDRIARTGMQDKFGDVLVPTVTDRIDAALIEQAGPDLGLIASFGAGVDHIDLAAAAARGILVTNTPGVFTDDTADSAAANAAG